MSFHPARRRVSWVALAVAAVAMAGLVWVRATSVTPQTSTVVASAKEARFDAADLSLDGPSDVQHRTVPRQIDSAAGEASKPASLELANRLVGQQGVDLSSPDWATEAELK